MEKQSELYKFLASARKLINKLPRYNSKFSNKIYDNHQKMIILVFRQKMRMTYRGIIKFFKFSHLARALLKLKKVPVNPVNTQVAAPGGTWYDILGFRHIHGEWNNAHRRHRIPPPTKYIDNRYMTAKVNAAKAYEDERDNQKKQELLKKWWSVG
jgi:hypothetical protein